MLIYASLHTVAFLVISDGHVVALGYRVVISDRHAASSDGRVVMLGGLTVLSGARHWRTCCPRPTFSEPHPHE